MLFVQTVFEIADSNFRSSSDWTFLHNTENINKQDISEYIISLSLSL